MRNSNSLNLTINSIHSIHSIQFTHSADRLPSNVHPTLPCGLSRAAVWLITVASSTHGCGSSRPASTSSPTTRPSGRKSASNSSSLSLAPCFCGLAIEFFDGFFLGGGRGVDVSSDQCFPPPAHLAPPMPLGQRGSLGARSRMALLFL